MSLTWGVDGFVRCYLTENGRDILLCGLDNVNGYTLRDYYEDNMTVSKLTVEVKATEIESVKDLLFLLERYKSELPPPLINELENLTDDAPTMRGQMLELVEAVSMIGVDFGYGKFYLDESHIEKAREIVKAK